MRRIVILLSITAKKVSFNEFLVIPKSQIGTLLIPGLQIGVNGWDPGIAITNGHIAPQCDL